jgi:hypothetical protein
MEKDNIIRILRNPAFTKQGKPRKFWEEKKGQTIVINKLRP